MKVSSLGRGAARGLLISHLKTSSPSCEGQDWKGRHASLCCQVRSEVLAFTRPGEWRQVRNADLRAKTAAHPFDQNFDTVPGGDEPSDQCLQALEWPLGNLDILSRLQSLIDLHKFI